MRSVTLKDRRRPQNNLDGGTTLSLVRTNVLTSGRSAGGKSGKETPLSDLKRTQTQAAEDQTGCFQTSCTVFFIPPHGGHCAHWNAFVIAGDH